DDVADAGILTLRPTQYLDAHHATGAGIVGDVEIRLHLAHGNDPFSVSCGFRLGPACRTTPDGDLSSPRLRISARSITERPPRGKGADVRKCPCNQINRGTTGGFSPPRFVQILSPWSPLRGQSRTSASTTAATPRSRRCRRP